MRVRRAAAGPVLAAVLAASALAGCGSDASSPGAATATTPAPPSGAPQPSGEQRAQFENLRACLEREGVELPGSGRPSAGGAPPQLDPDALQACAEFLPEGGPPGMGAPPAASS